MGSSLLIAVAVVQQRGQVLIGQRAAGTHLAGLWEFPGGKIRAGETPQAAAIRECREETGLEVEVLSAWPVAEHYYPPQPGDDAEPEGRRVTIHFLRCRPVDATVQPTPPFRWVAQRDLPRYEFPAANAALVAELARADAFDDESC